MAPPPAQAEEFCPKEKDELSGEDMGIVKQRQVEEGSSWSDCRCGLGRWSDEMDLADYTVSLPAGEEIVRV